MMKRPLSSGMDLDVEQQNPMKQPRISNSQQTPGVIPDDIAGLYELMDSGASLDMNLQLSQNRCEWKSLKKIKQLKAEKRMLRRDLKRSRQVGKQLESDMLRLHRQRQKELSCERRAQRDIREREEVITARERASTCLQQDLECQKKRLESDLNSCLQNEVEAVVRTLVDHVELSSKEANLDIMNENLEWSISKEHDCRQCVAWLEQEVRETEAFVAVEQRLLNEQLKSLATQLEATQQRPQEERLASVDLKNAGLLMQQGNIYKTTCITGLALSNLTLANAQNEGTTKMEAKQVEWNRSVRQLQQKHEEVLAEHVKLERQLQTENSQLQQNLREAQLGELKGQQEIGAARATAETSRRLQEEMETKLKALEDELRTVKRDGALPQFRVPF